MLQQARREGKIAYFSHTKLIIKNSLKPSSTASATEEPVGGANNLATSGKSTVGLTQRESGKATPTALASTAATTSTATSVSGVTVQNLDRDTLPSQGFTSGVQKTANKSTVRKSTRTKF